MPVIAVAGLKGGVGKSTIAVALAVELHARGRTVLLGDSDPQRSALTWAAQAAELEVGAPTTVALHSGFHRPGQLPGGYDWTVVDTAPQDGKGLRSALMVADLVVFPVLAGPFDAWRLADGAEQLEEAQTVRRELAGLVVLNRMARSTLAASARDAVAELGIPVAKTTLGNRVAFAEALAAGMGPTTYAPTSPAADEVRALVDEVRALTSKRGRKLHAV